MDKHECTKRAHTRAHWTLSAPQPCSRAAPPHNNPFMKVRMLQSTHGSRREGAIGLRHLKLETGPKKSPEEGRTPHKAPMVRGLLPGTVLIREEERAIHPPATSVWTLPVTPLTLTTFERRVAFLRFLASSDISRALVNYLLEMNNNNH